MRDQAFQILQQQTTAVVLLDETLKVQYLNESAEFLLNTSNRRAEGQPLTALIQWDNQLWGAFQRILAGSGQIRLRNHELSLATLLTEKHLDCAVNGIQSDEGEHFILELNEAESEGMGLRDTDFIERQRANQAVIRGMAHEIRNPLGGIRGAAQLLAEEMDDGFAEYTNIIIQETDRLTALVNRMQASTRADMEESVNIHQVVEHVRQILQAEVGESYRLLQDYDPSLPPISGNRDLLIQSLLNVMRNAVEALESRRDEKRILVRTRIDRMVLEGCSRQVVRVEVEDNGPGIDPDLRPRIFDPMVTDKADGTGLGLSITAEIIAQHGGAIDVLCEPGRTVFRMFLPTSRSGLQG